LWPPNGSADSIIGLVAAEAARQQGLAEADREAQHLDAAQSRSDVVAEFVHHHQDADGNQEPQDGMQHTHARRASR
jgi:hypothetical protein